MNHPRYPIVLGLTTLSCALLATGAGCDDGNPAPPPNRPSAEIAPADATRPVDVTSGAAPGAPGMGAVPPASPAGGAGAAEPAPAPAQPVLREETPVTPASDGSFVAGGVRFSPPEAWHSEPPASSMRVAQYAMPAANEGGEAGVLAVFINIGGGIEMNITRWVAQIQEQVAPPARESFNVGTLTIATVEVTGTFASGMPGGPTEPVANTTLLGAVVSGGPGGDVFLKATGPAEVMSAHREAWLTMLRSAASAR